MRLALQAALACLVPATGLFAGVTEDDLALVKRAVNERPRPEPSAVPAAPTRAREAPHAQTAKWLRVRIVGKTDKKASVSINLPLGVVRALGDDLQLDDDWRDRHGKALTLGDVLRTLEGGQSLVEVDGDDARIRVWID